MQKIRIDFGQQDIFYDKCSNGLEIFLVPNDKVKSFYMTFTVKYGSVGTEWEMENKKYRVPNGVAHFLEHLKFNQPRNKTAHEYFKAIGSHINAWTSHKETSYEVLSSTHFAENLNYLLNYVQTPYWTKTLVEKEKGIIIEEVKMGEDKIGNNIYQASLNALFHHNKHKYLVTGDINDIKGTTIEDINLAYNSFYHPKNMFVVITGNFDVNEALMVIKENQSSKTFNKYLYPKVIVPSEPRSVVSKNISLVKNIAVPKIMLSYKMLIKDFNMSLLSLIVAFDIILRINFGKTSSLQEELENEGLTVGRVYFGLNFYNDFMVISFNATSKYPNELINKLMAKMQNLEISETQIERKKKKLLSSFILDTDNIEALNQFIIIDIIREGKIQMNEYINLLKEVNYEKIRAVLKQIKTKDSSVVIGSNINN